MERDDYERYLIAIIEQLQREYEMAAKPYIDALVLLRAMDLPRPIVLSGLPPEQAQTLLDDLRQSNRPTSP